MRITIFTVSCIILISTANGSHSNVCSKGAAYQLLCFKQNQPYTSKDKLTAISGSPIGSYDKSKTCGRRGPMLLEDQWFLKEITRFTREKIPPRRIHSKGAGAWGTFTVTSNEIRKYSKAKVFWEKSTKVFVRFSKTVTPPGSADTLSDLIGFAIKFYTTEGNWDVVGLQMPVFPIRDARMFPSLVHAQSPNPATNTPIDPIAFFDFMCSRTETMNALLRIASALGTPASYRHIDGFGVNVFKLVNEKHEYVYCKFIWKTNQGIKNLTNDEASRFRATDPDLFTSDLFNAISEGNFPKWTFYVQIMSEKQAQNSIDDPFDVTKDWPQSKYPYIEVGELVLDRNPENYFREVEKSHFGPINMPPGIEPSPDKMLLARLVAYEDASYYRLGPYRDSIPVNQPTSRVITPYFDEGYQKDITAMPSYIPNSFLNVTIDSSYSESPQTLPMNDRTCDRYDFDSSRDLVQPREFYNSLIESDQRSLAENLAFQMNSLVIDEIKERCFHLFSSIHKKLAADIRSELNKPKNK